jgi:hypothetical protein
MKDHDAEYEVDLVLEALGRVAAASAGLEWALTDVHETLLWSPRGHVVVAGENFDQARRGCIEMAEHIGDPVFSLVRPLVDDAVTVWADRNAVVHGLWLAAIEDQLPQGTAVAMRMRRKSGREVRTWTVESLRNLVDRVTAASDALVVLDERLHSERDLRACIEGQPSFE